MTDKNYVQDQEILEEEIVDEQEQAPECPEQDTSSAEANEAEQLKQEITELNQRLMRVAADFDNFRKRSRTEKEELAKYANSSLICELLPVLDNFQRALEVKEPGGEVQKFLAGMEMIYRQLLQILTQSGLEPIKAVGELFNPEKHEAVMQLEDSSVPDNTVIEELRCGYIFKDRVVRPSMVKVAKNDGK
ncbi:MAG: nucleotide exchange factor GrpE [Peptococcaceae bacterium]